MTILDTIKSIKPTADFTKLIKAEFPEVAVPSKKHRQEYLYKYLVQGKALGLEGAELVQYAAEGVDKLFKTMPHLAYTESALSTDKVVMGVKRETKPVPKAPKASKVEKAPKVEKVEKPAKVAKAPKVAKVTKADIHPDGTVFFRADRQKWIAMLNGKQEAARPTKEGCVKFLEKKGFDMSKVNVIEV